MTNQSHASGVPIVAIVDIVNKTEAADVGEYPFQDGFGWPNGVAVDLLD